MALPVFACLPPRPAVRPIQFVPSQQHCCPSSFFLPDSFRSRVWHPVPSPTLRNLELLVVIALGFMDMIPVELLAGTQFQPLVDGVIPMKNLNNFEVRYAACAGWAVRTSVDACMRGECAVYRMQCATCVPDGTEKLRSSNLPRLSSL